MVRIRFGDWAEREFEPGTWGQRGVFPIGELVRLVVGDRVGDGVDVGAVEPPYGDLHEPEKLRGLEARVAGDHFAGAGTPDRVGPISPAGVLEWPGYALDIAGHWCCDVFPFDCMWSLNQYLEIRPPYDDNCRANPPGPGGRKLPPKREPSEWELMVRYCENGCQNEAFLKASAWDWTFEEMDAYYEDCVDDCIEYFRGSHN